MHVHLKLLLCVVLIGVGRNVAAEELPLPEPNVPVGSCLANGPDFFVVSSRDCPQEWDGRHAARMRYYRPCSHGQLHPSSREEFQQWLRPGTPLCVMVHGSLVSWEYMQLECVNTWPWLRSAAPDQPLQVVFFTWPSDLNDYCLPVRLGLLGSKSSLNGLFLSQFLASVPPDHPLCLIGHSHGSRLISTALHLLAGGATEGICLGRNYARGRRIRAVYAASAMDHDWMNPGQRFDLALHSLESLLILRNRKDFALRAYPLISLDRPLGWIGFTGRDRRQLGPAGRKVSELDITEMVGASHDWVYYYRNPRIAIKIMYYVYFNEPRLAVAPH